MQQRSPARLIAGSRAFRTLAGTVIVASVAFTLCPANALAVTLVPFTTDPISFPVDITHAGDNRLFVAEKGGLIRIVQSDGSVMPTPFLDVGGLVSGGGERGLLGLAFHPDYAINGYFYVNYTNLAGDTVVARYQVGGDPNVANPASASIVLTIDQPFSNHNGGDLAFGPDGYLYIGLGDGGSGCDPNANAQNTGELLGKMLRIDVDSSEPYAIPPSNPFFGSPTVREEIWSLGLRNPWRFAFDRATGDLYVADVGQGSREEIDFQATGSDGGENYGWRCYEGNLFNPCGDPCSPAGGHVPPVHEYSHASGRCSVTGGFVYRGSSSPSLDGEYFFADYCSDEFWSLHTANGGASWNLTSYGVLVTNLAPTTFGEDVAGEVYVGGAGSSTIYRIVDEPVSPPPACPSTPAVGCSATGKAKLKIRRAADPSKNRLQWKWSNGPQVVQADFGDPVAGGTSYELCLYDGMGQAVIDAGVPSATGWRALSDKGYRFADKSVSEDGVTKVQLKGGSDGKSKIGLKAAGGELDLVAMPLDEATGLTVQLIRSDASACWESVFPAPLDADDAERVSARIP